MSKLDKMKELMRSLKAAVMLGTIYREPVILQYLDEMGNKLVKDTMIISATERYVMLKGGETIPISKIVKVLA